MSQNSLLQHLKGSGLTKQHATKLRWRALNAQQIHPTFADRPAFVIPYFELDGSMIPLDTYARCRYLEAPPKGFSKQKPLRYTQLPRSGVRAYLPPLVDWQKISEDPGTARELPKGLSEKGNHDTEDRVHDGHSQNVCS